MESGNDYGVSIETLDNPGWFLIVDLQATAMDDLTRFPSTKSIGASTTGSLPA
jgi:hypothetical protein